MKTTIDARRLLCPLPVIRAQDKVAELQNGDQLEVICTDPGAKQDIPAWCRINGHQIDQVIERNNEIIILLTVAGESGESDA